MQATAAVLCAIRVFNHQRNKDTQFNLQFGVHGETVCGPNMTPGGDGDADSSLSPRET